MRKHALNRPSIDKFHEIWATSGLTFRSMEENVLTQRARPRGNPGNVFMFIGSAPGYKFQQVEPKELSLLNFDVFEDLRTCIGARAWAVGERGERINESPLEFLYNPLENKAAILVARTANKAVVTTAASLEDAIERFLRIGGKGIE